MNCMLYWKLIISRVYFKRLESSYFIEHSTETTVLNSNSVLNTVL